MSSPECRQWSASTPDCPWLREKWSDGNLSTRATAPVASFSVGIVVTGKLVAPHAGPTPTEEDFLKHVQAVVATDPQATRWHFVCDNLNIHQSESLVRWVAQISGIATDWGKKGEYGIL